VPGGQTGRVASVRRVRVALVAGPDPGHAFPLIALGHELTRRGHTCLLVTGDRWAGCGLPWMDLPMVPPAPGESLGARLWVRSVAMTRLLTPLLAEWHPDLVLADTLTMCGTFAAAVLEVPCIEVLPHPLQDASVGLPPNGIGLAAGTWWLTRRRDALLRRLTAPALARGAVEKAEALAALGLGSADPVLRLVGTLPALEPARPDWPANAHVVGALEWEPPGADPTLPEGDGPLVAVASSTASGPGHSDLLTSTLQAVRVLRTQGQPARVCCMGLSPAAHPGELEPWATVSPGRQSVLLDQAAVLVCGGGGGILAKALRRGLPVIGSPGPGDQKENLARVARLGAGVVLREPSQEHIATALQKVLSTPGYAEAARAAGRTAEGLGVGYACDLAESAL
jgi:UDP:flavonoid glycosyltransferase YjiC (YdhE family)